MPYQEKKKILYLVTQSEHGGAQRYVLDLAIGLKDEFEVSVAFGEQGEEGYLARQLKDSSVPYYALKNLKRSINPIHDLRAFFELIKLFRDLKPDVVHLNSSKISILGSFAGIFSKAKIVYTVHGWVFNEPDRNGLFYRFAERLTSFFKDKIICISHFDLELAKKELSIPEKKLALVPNGREEINFLPKTEAWNKLATYIPTPYKQGGGSEIILGTIGGLYKTKGFEYFIQAVKLLKDDGRDVRAIVIGEGPARAELASLIHQFRLKNTFFLPGRIDASHLLKAFDIFVNSSVKEGLVYTIIEAMQAELPIVATRVGGNPDLIEDQKEGLLVDPANPEQLASAIKTLIERPELRQEFSRAARAKSLSQFSLESMINKTKTLY